MKNQAEAEAFERYRQEQKRCLGVAVCQLRTEARLTPSQLAKRAKVSARWLQRLEANQLHTNYSIERIDRIACALGVELYEVYKRAAEMLESPPWLDKEGTQSDE
jgi:transcriptional regulator with XRE-family HTH domain